MNTPSTCTSDSMAGMLRISLSPNPVRRPGAVRSKGLMGCSSSAFACLYMSSVVLVLAAGDGYCI